MVELLLSWPLSAKWFQFGLGSILVQCLMGGQEILRSLLEWS